MSASDLPTADLRVELPGHVLDIGARALLTTGGEQVELRAQAMDVLCHLASRPRRVVTKAELLSAVWPGVVVTDDSLVQAISDARRAIGDEAHRIIQTVPRRGYRYAPAAAESMVLPSLMAQPAAPGQAAEGQTATAAATGGGARRRSQPWWALAALALLLAGGLAVSGWWTKNRADAVAASSSSPDRPPIAVLDFASPDASPKERQFARGFAEDLATELSRNADLRVIAAQSSFAAAGSGDPWPVVAERLGVRYVVNGQVRREGEALRINLQLLDGRNRQMVWSANQDVKAEGVYVVRDALVMRIAGSVLSTMQRAERAHGIQRAPASLDIYEMTLRAITLKHRFTPQDSREAKALLERVVALDPQYAPAWLYLGTVNLLDAALRLNGPLTPERMNEGTAQLEHSLTLDARIPHAYASLTFAYSMAERPHDAVQMARRCVELGPSDAECSNIMAMALAYAGQPEEAAKHAQRARDTYPNPPCHVLGSSGLVAWALRDHPRALRDFEECLRQAPHFLLARMGRLVALAEAGRLADARLEAAALLKQAPALTADAFGHRFAPEAHALAERRVAAALQAGIPPGAASAAAR